MPGRPAVHHHRYWFRPLVSLLVLLTVLLAPSSAGGMQSGGSRLSAPSGPLLGSAASWFSGPSSSLRPNTAGERGARLAAAGCTLGDINCDGIVDIRDYGLWRQNFGASACGNAADLNGDCLVDIRDYGIWRQNFGQTGPTATATAAATATPTATVTTTPTLPGRAYVASSSN